MPRASPQVKSHLRFVFKGYNDAWEALPHVETEPLPPAAIVAWFADFVNDLTHEDKADKRWSRLFRNVAFVTIEVWDGREKEAESRIGEGSEERRHEDAGRPGGQKEVSEPNGPPVAEVVRGKDVKATRKRKPKSGGVESETSDHLPNGRTPDDDSRDIVDDIF